MQRNADVHLLADLPRIFLSLLFMQNFALQNNRKHKFKGLNLGNQLRVSIYDYCVKIDKTGKHQSKQGGPNIRDPNFV